MNVSDFWRIMWRFFRCRKVRHECHHAWSWFSPNESPMCNSYTSWYFSLYKCKRFKPSVVKCIKSELVPSETICSFFMWRRSCLGGLAVMTLAQNARDRGSIPRWGRGTEFFGLSEPTVTFGGQLWDSLTYLVKAWGHASPRGGWMWRRSCLGGLAVMTLARNARDRGSIPRWGRGTEFFGPSEPTVTFRTLRTMLLVPLDGGHVAMDNQCTWNYPCHNIVWNIVYVGFGSGQWNNTTSCTFLQIPDCQVSLHLLHDFWTVQYFMKYEFCDDFDWNCFQGFIN